MEDDDETEYLAGLLFDDRAFCMRAYYVLKDYIGHPVKELGDIEVDKILPIEPACARG